jgi:hypothetical protein
MAPGSVLLLLLLLLVVLLLVLLVLVLIVVAVGNVLLQLINTGSKSYHGCGLTSAYSIQRPHAAPTCTSVMSALWL